MTNGTDESNFVKTDIVPDNLFVLYSQFLIALIIFHLVVSFLEVLN